MYHQSLFLPVIFSYSIDSTLLGSTLSYSHRLFLFGISLIFDKTIKSCQKKGYYTLFNYMQCTINTNVCVCSSHPVTGHLMLIAVDQKNRTLENLQPLAIYILSLLPVIHCIKGTVRCLRSRSSTTS